MPRDTGRGWNPRSASRRMVHSPWFHLLAAFILCGLVLSFVAKPYWVPSSSMEETLHPGDRVLVSRLAYLWTPPSRGEVVVFDADTDWSPAAQTQEGALKSALRWLGETSGFGPSGPHTLVKRVVGLPGQTVKCCTSDGSITVDGLVLSEPYVTHDLPFERGVVDCTTTPQSLRCFDEVTVPDDSYLVLGDNRGASSDSAARCRTSEDTHPPDSCWRWARSSEIVGRAVAVLWPVERWTGL